MKQDTDTLTIREMMGEDIEPLAEALDWPWTRIDHRWKELLGGYREVFVADTDGWPVGSVSINEREERPGLLHLFALDVGAKIRNRGIGTRLIGFVEDEARRRGLAGVYLDVATYNTDALRLYERLGYVKEGKPMLNSWQRRGDNGEIEEVVEEQFRMVKRFG